MTLSTQERKAIAGMLAALGRLPPGDGFSGEEDTPLSPEGRLAAFLLEQTRLIILSQGWHFNTFETTVSLEKGVGQAPEHTLAVLRSRPLLRLEETENGQKLVSIKDAPYAEKATTEVSIDISFDQLPLPCRRYVEVKATRLLQDRLMTSPTLHAFTERDEMEAYAHLKMWEAEAQAPNMLTTLSMR